MGLTLEITGLKEPIKDFTGAALILQDQRTGLPLPDDQQLKLGDVFLNLLGQMQAGGQAQQGQPPPLTGKEAVFAYGIGQRIAEAMEGDGTYTAGEAALGILRRVVDENRIGYILKVIGPVARALGMGE